MKKNLIVGASLGLSGIEAVICDDQFNELEKQSKPFPGRLGKESIVAKFAKVITSLTDFHMCYAVGVALPAVFDNSDKKIVSCSIKELEGANFYQLLSKRIDKPIYVLRRNYCSLLAEQAFGAAKNVQNAVLVEIGRDIAASFLFSGKIYRGSNNAAGQIDKIIVDITREKRNKAGEFGALVSGEGLEALTGKSIYQILKESPQSELVNKQILRDLKESLITGLYNVKLLFDPEIFIINGDILENFHLFKASFADLKVPIIKSELGKTAPALGAAVAAYNQSRRKSS
ncbi:MAG: ROK family protein [Candidatus Berkelbacteria bacterium]|nr:ROK family protein [Candidatus Berkelbacteria bacterium]